MDGSRKPLTAQQERALRLLRARRPDLLRSLPGWGNSVRSLRARGLIEPWMGVG